MRHLPLCCALSSMMLSACGVGVAKVEEPGRGGGDDRAAGGDSPDSPGDSDEPAPGDGPSAPGDGPSAPGDSDDAPTTFTLTITRAGSGTITSDPAGIDCGATCSFVFPAGTVVTLTATPGPDYQTVGWSSPGVTCPGTGPCAVTLSKSRVVAAAFRSTQAAVDLCEGLIKNDKSPHPMTADQAPPDLGEFIVDPQFNTRIRRITQGEPGDMMKPAYSTIAAWNADETYLVLLDVNRWQHVLYDGMTYEPLGDLPINPPDAEQFFWHTSDPDLLFYVDNQGAHPRLVRFHVGASEDETLHTFTDCDGWLSSGDDPVFNSWDSNFFSFLCSDQPGGADDFVLVYQVDTDSVIAHETGTIAGDGSAPKPPRLAASGTLTLWDDRVTDMALVTLRTIPIRNPDEHTSLGRLANGHDTFNSVIFDPPDGEDDDDFDGTLVTYDLTDASHQVIIGPKTGYPYPQDSHVSALTFGVPGWVLVSSGDGSPDGQEVLALELAYANTNTGDVCRIAHHHAWGKENTVLGDDIAYFAEAHGVPSPSGTRILFGSDWDNGSSVDAYVVELPTY